MGEGERAAPGRLEVITGPMFAGKTEELLTRLARAEREGYLVIAVKPSVDARYNDSFVVSHNQSKRPALVAEASREIRDLATIYSVVGIDESHFFDDELPLVAQDLRSAGCRVIADGLDFDFRTEPFASTHALASVADEAIRLEAVCDNCGAPATLTQRLQDGLPAPRDDDRIMVGGHELYEPRCRPCYADELVTLAERSPAA